MNRKGLSEYIGGPLLARWGKKFIVGGRRLTEAGPRTTLYWLQDESLHPFAELPSDGDNSYPGFVELDDGSGTRILVFEPRERRKRENDHGNLSG